MKLNQILMTTRVPQASHDLKPCKNIQISTEKMRGIW